MGRTEEARVKIVLAMESLEDALVDGLPAQSPQSEAAEIRTAIVLFRARIEMALTHVSEAELLIFGWQIPKADISKPATLDDQMNHLDIFRAAL